MTKKQIEARLAEILHPAIKLTYFKNGFFLENSKSILGAGRTLQQLIFDYDKRQRKARQCPTQN